MAWQRHVARTAALLVMGLTGFARAQPPCTVKKGQDASTRAVQEFSCVIDAPAEVVGYRGRAVAALLPGLYWMPRADRGPGVPAAC
jgi:hypothetical protein